MYKIDRLKNAEKEYLILSKKIREKPDCKLLKIDLKWIRIIISAYKNQSINQL